MARAISKGGFNTKAYVYVVDNMDNEKTVSIDDEDIIYTDILTMRGRKSENACQINAEKTFKTKNVMVCKVTYEQSAKLTLSASDFIKYSEVCVDGTSYGHEFVTAQFKVTILSVMYRDKNGMHTDTIYYDGETTDSKLLNFARETTKSKMCVVKSKVVATMQRYMTRALYEQLATIVESKDDTNNDNNDNNDNTNENDA